MSAFETQWRHGRLLILGSRGARAWRRGLRPGRTPVHVFLPPSDDPLVALAELLARRPAPPGLPAGAQLDEEGDELAFSFAYHPGVPLVDVLALAREVAGVFPVEIAAILVAQIARALAWLCVATDRPLPPVTPADVLARFDGQATLALGPLAWEEPRAGEDDVVRGLGALLYQLLHGVPPGPAGGARASPHGPGGTVVTRRPLPPEMERLLAIALGDDDDRRFETCTQLARSLEDLYPEDRGAAGRWLAALFPDVLREAEAFLEELPLVELVHAQGDSEPTQPDALTGEDLWLRVPADGSGPAFEVQAVPVANAALCRFLDETGRDDPPGFFGRDPARAREPAVFVDAALASSYAAHHGARLPSDDEWSRAVEAGAGSVGLVWEWTRTPRASGYVVRGGPWRNRVEGGRVGNRSYEDEAASDVGLRLVRDVED